MNAEEFLKHLWKERATGILRTTDKEVASKAMEAAIRGGFRIIEFTLTTPGALELIEEFSRRKDLIVGAGTTLRIQDAQEAVKAGARYLVSPVIDEEVIEEAHRLSVAIMPGTHTPTEMLKAHRAGAQLQKLFPAPAGGPVYVRACLGPLPFLRIVPTQGADAGNAPAFLDAGAFAIGFVGPLFDPGDLQAERYDRIEARARNLKAAVAIADRR